MNHCYWGGFLVGGQSPLPVDPIDHDVKGLPIMGCRHLVCRHCRQPVRDVVDVVPTKDDPPALYAEADLAGSPLVKPMPGARLYVCRCQLHPELRGPRALDEPGAEPPQAPGVPWACNGHPLAELPREIDGIEVTADNAGELARRSFGGWTPLAARPADQKGGFWAARLHSRLAGTPWAGAVIAAAVSALDDADPQVLARALHFFAIFPAPAGMMRALELLEGDRGRFAGVPDPVTAMMADKTLEDSLWRVVIPLLPDSERARDLARIEALAPGRGRSALYAALASADPTWLAEHAEEIARATPAMIGELVTIVRYRFPPGVPARPVLERLKALQATK
jgi:hypothetical protein